MKEHNAVSINLIYIYLNSFTIHEKPQTLSPGSTYSKKSHKNIVKQGLIASLIYKSERWFSPVLDK